MLTEQEFQLRCGESMESLYSKLANAADRFDFDVDFNAGALSIEFEDPRERFVVSPNSPVRQIWVSAHVQSFKLDWNAATEQFELPSGQSLDAMIAGAIQKRIPEFTF